MVKTSIWIKTFILITGFLLSSTTAWAKWPAAEKVDADLCRHWQKTWPAQKLVHVEKKTECEQTWWAKPSTKKKRKACLIKADAYVEKGSYRYLIYRDTYLYYVQRKLRSVQLGELEKAWKEGGVPAPSQAEVEAMLATLAQERFATDTVKIQVIEMGQARPYGENYRITVAHGLTYQKDGKQEEKKELFTTLESSGGPWKIVPTLAM